MTDISTINILNMDAILYDKYSTDLDGYNLIKTKEEMLDLKMGCCIRYISKYDGELRKGGFLVKKEKKNNNIYCTLKQDNRFYVISFDSNRVYYKKQNRRKNNIRKWADCFITDMENDVYDIID